MDIILIIIYFFIIMKCNNIENIRYKNINYKKSVKENKKSIEVIGLDTEAYQDGRCFMLATSLGDVYKYNDYPSCFFSRKYRDKNFVVYNLKYDEGALLQFLSKKRLEELRENGITTYRGYTIKCISQKFLSIKKGKHYFNVYDMYNFFLNSLSYNAKKFLSEDKLEIDTKCFTKEYVTKNYDKIAKYCIQDAILVKKLADLLIKKFEAFNIYPRKLFSTAYISYNYFRKTTNYVTVERFWNEDKKLLDFALKSYNGGKFEVTEKGYDYYYEYDIISAYPFEIAQLVDITNARIVWSKKYRRYATYGFLYVRMKITKNIYNCISILLNNVNCYCIGYIERVITKQEYEYLTSLNIDIEILDAVWLHIDKKEYIYKQEIEKIVKLKQKYKEEKKELETYITKILLNSLYGKMIQLIKKKDYYEASSSFNPIHASIITSNVRLRVTKLQQQYNSIVAVHTDSIISKKPIDSIVSDVFGGFTKEVEGYGVVLGSGIYQIGDKTKFRGFNNNYDLIQLCDSKKSVIELYEVRAYTWREVIFHGWDKEYINKFEKIKKELQVNFDKKRFWIDDYTSFNEVFKRKVESLPIYNLPF